jgi:hypothetical protein
MFLSIMHATIAVRHKFLGFTGGGSDNRYQVATLGAAKRQRCRLAIIELFI